MIRFPIFLAALAFATPALAFDNLWRDLAVIVGDETSAAPVFFYAAPDKTVRPNDSQWPANTDIGGAMYGVRASAEPTGVDFSKIDAVFETGNPPDQIYILHGEPGFAAEAPAALGSRAFTASTIEGFEVFSLGEDYKIDIDNRNADPFAGGIGRFYRLAVASDNAVVTFSTGLMERTLASLAAPEFCAPCIPWRSMLDSIRTAAGPDARLVGASGFPLGAFLNPRDGTAPSPGLPPFVFTMYAVTSGSGPGLHLSLFFPDAVSAQAGAKAVVQGIEALVGAAEADSPMAGGTASVTVSGPIATVSVAFPHALGANTGYNSLLRLTFSGEFAALTPSR